MKTPKHDPYMQERLQKWTERKGVSFDCRFVVGMNKDYDDTWADVYAWLKAANIPYFTHSSHSNEWRRHFGFNDSRHFALFLVRFSQE